MNIVPPCLRPDAKFNSIVMLIYEAVVAIDINRTFAGRPVGEEAGFDLTGRMTIKCRPLADNQRLGPLVVDRSENT